MEGSQGKHELGRHLGPTALQLVPGLNLKRRRPSIYLLNRLSIIMEVESDCMHSKTDSDIDPYDKAFCAGAAGAGCLL
jgi:hypothetical protein